MFARRLIVALMLVTASGSLAPVAGAQGLGGLRKKAEEAKRRVEEAAAAAGRRAADSAKAQPPAAATAAAPASAAAGSPSAAAGVAGQAAAGDPKVWDNYDFVPGSKVLFYTDFSEDKTGNFARGLKYRSGPVEVVERDGVKMLRATGRAEFLVPVGKRLPDRFTLEIDVIAPSSGVLTAAVSLEGGATSARSATSANVVWNPRGAWIQGSGMNMGTSTVNIPEATQAATIGKLAHLRVLMDSGYFKMFVNERRIYNMPELAFQRDSVIRIALEGADDAGAVFVTGIRVAESETDVLYDALAAKGRWVTQGILFATGKADVQPESRPVLKEIAATLKQHPELKILIEGHTDNVGAAAANLALSDARAAAVKAALARDFAVDESRITTKGLGDTKPAMPNATAAGRAQNRRVELVKL